MISSQTRILIRVILVATPLAAQITNVSITAVTNTQAILRYTPADGSVVCSLAVSTSPTFSPLVHDVDPAIFNGSNLDSRTGNLADGQAHVFVIGKRAAEQGADGHWYSRALEAFADHYYSITCGSDNATGSFTTANIALGNTYNEALPAAPGVTSSSAYSYAGQYAWPEFLNWNTGDPAARQETIIDPQTGLSLKRMTMPQDLGFHTDYPFRAAKTPTLAWSNPGSALTDDTSYASYSGASSDWLVLKDPQISFPNSGILESLTLSVKAWCSGTCAGDDAKIQVCLTVNGVSCWPNGSNVHDIALGTTASSTTFLTYGTGSSSMYPWTPAGFPPVVAAETTSRSGRVNVDASGNVSWTGSGSLFYPGWSAGSEITIAGSVCSIAAVAHPQSLSVDPSSCNPALSLPLTGVPWSAGNFGVMIRKKTSSLDTINVQYAKYTLNTSAQIQWPSGGGTKICNTTPSLNSVTGRLGYHCMEGNTPQIYWIDSTTGDANWLGVPFIGNHPAPDGWANKACGPPSVTLAATSAMSPVAYYCTAVDEKGRIIVVGCTMTTTNQTGSLSYSCSNLTPGSIGKNLAQLVADFTSGYSPSFDPTQFDSIGIVASQKGRLMMAANRSYQDTAAWLMVFDPFMVDVVPGCVGGGKPGCVIAAQTSWAVAPCRWCTLHSTGYAGESDIMVLAGKFFGDWVGVPGGGYYTSIVTSGAMTSQPSIPPGAGGCPNGARGCDLVTVDGEPCNMAPAASIGGHAADPLNCPKNAAWTYLQDATPGDVLTVAGTSEFVRLIAKDGNQWLLQRGYGSSMPGNPASPIGLTENCLSRDDGFTVGVSTLAWIWDFVKDPHGLNSDGTTLRVWYSYDHAAATENMSVGGGPWYDPNSKGGYAILDGPGYGPPNKWGQLGPPFAGSGGITVANEISQEHPSHPQYTAPDSEQKWFLDARPLSGPGNTIADQATPVAGQLYKFASTTTDGDNLTHVGGPAAQFVGVSRKIQPTMALCGTQPLIDISSAVQGDVIPADATGSYQYCVARKAGECRSASSQGDIYVNCPYASPRWNNPRPYGCNNVFPEPGLGNDMCVTNTGAYLNGIAQIGYQDAVDATGGAGRLLTHGLIHYRVNNVNENVRTTPDGKWLLFEGIDFGGSEYQILSGKMLPYPTPDGIDRTKFVPLTLQLQPPDGLSVDNAVVQFGYVENGSAGQFYCTSRKETCVATAAAVGKVPFLFPSDASDGTLTTLAGAPCSSGCSVAIPGISQRMVYYQVLYRDAGNNILAQTRPQVTAVP